jgi:predicted PurR-regulated permease PerM
VNISELRQTVGVTGRYFLNLFIIPILSFLILKDGRLIRDAILEIFDGNGHAEGFLTDAHKLLLEYMRALLYLCLATLISFTIALNLMHVRYANLLGLIAFMLEFIPLAGPLASAVIIIGFSEFNHYDHVPWIIAFLLAYRLFQDYVLSPHLMKKGVKLDPLLILFGIFAGGEIGNVSGIFLSVPLLALMRLMFYELRKPRADTNNCRH